MPAQIIAGIQFQKNTWGRMDAKQRRSWSTHISLALGTLTPGGKVREDRDSSAGLSCTAVLPAGHGPKEEEIPYPPTALCFTCTVSKYLGKQWIRLRADFPFQGEFGSCSAVNHYWDQQPYRYFPCNCDREISPWPFYHPYTTKRIWVLTVAIISVSKNRSIA